MGLLNFSKRTMCLNASYHRCEGNDTMTALFSCLKRYSRRFWLFNFPIVFLNTISLVLSIEARFAPSNTGGATAGIGSTSGTIIQTATMNSNDSALLTIDLFSHLGRPFSGQFQEGDPLGTGGKISNTYNSFLYGAAPSGYPAPVYTDLKSRYEDFSYIPLWQPHNLSMRIGYRFLPTLSGRVSLGYCLEQDATINGKDIPLALGELLFKWTPRKIGGLNISFGRLFWTGAYVTVFDQLPLENFSFDGTVFNYTKTLMNDVTIVSKIGLGAQQFSTRFYYTDTAGYLDSYYQYTGERWLRLHCIGSISATYKNNFSIQAVGGYQKIPKRQTEIKIGIRPSDKIFDSIPESCGWHVGLQLNGRIGKTEQFITLAYGKNDVFLGWSAPPYVDRKTFHLTTTYRYDVDDFGIHNFGREGCSLLHGTWWIDFRSGRLKGSAGVWAVYSIPADITSTYVFEDIDHENNYAMIQDSVSVSTQRSLSVKCAFDVAYRTVGPLYMGLRADVIRYQNPNAHANTYEYQCIDNGYYYLKNQPSLWEKEAINCKVITPYLLLNIANMLHVKGAYAFAFYDREVYRQGKAGKEHGNLVLSTTFTWQFAKMKTDK